METTKAAPSGGSDALETLGSLLLVAFLLACGGFVYLLAIMM